MIDTRTIQKALKEKGFDPGPIDGIMGPRTEAAICRFKASEGLWARPYIGPITLSRLLGPAAALQKRDGTPAGSTEAPWVNELGKYLWKHETRDNAKLKAWLKSDGRTLGDPKELPWCGDAMETAIRLSLPMEPWSGRVAANPYLARNWLDFGVPCEMSYGAIAVLWRGSRNGTSGHVAAVVGYDPKRRRLRIRGGNQSNMVSDAWISEDRVLGYRKPATWRPTLPPVPIMNSKGAVVSRNEA